jgi:hypothetical protein
MGWAEFAIERPIAIVASVVAVGLMEFGAGQQRSVDRLPEITVPVDF